MKPRAITGFGIASVFGVGQDAFYQGLRGAKPLGSVPPSAITAFDTAGLGSMAAAEIPQFDATKYLGDKGLRTLDRLTKIMIVSAREALTHAGVKADGKFLVSTPERTGLCSSNAYGSLEAITELDRVAVLEDARYINPAKFPNTVSNSASGYVSIWEDLRALNVAVSDGNCGGLDVVACADMYLETDRADVLVVGGAESMSEALFRAFEKLKAIGGSAILAEASVSFVLERNSEAKARGARVLAEVVGCGTAFMAPENDGTLIYASEEALTRASAMALRDAGLETKDIDGIVTGVAGIAYFDKLEEKALATFGVPMIAPKVLLGETLGAGGSIGMAVALAHFQGHAMEHELAAPKPIPADAKHILVSSLGYYGNASAVIMRRAS
jgi:3-oxoacyl-[acyl-carrier-protein] synthase II